MFKSNQYQKKNPLLVLWNVISTFGSILGLSSLASTWISDFQKWQNFIAEVIQTYCIIVSEVYKVLFFWLPIEIPEWLQHYLILGIIFFIAASKAESRIHIRWYLLWYFNRKGFFSKNAIATRNMLAIAIWPLSLFCMFKELHEALIRRRRSTFVKHTTNVEQAIRHSMWFFSIIVGAVILLSLAAQI